jgi:hypothetical protein
MAGALPNATVMRGSELKEKDAGFKLAFKFCRVACQKEVLRGCVVSD